jgi:hypothetical protein
MVWAHGYGNPAMFPENLSHPNCRGHLVLQIVAGTPLGTVDDHSGMTSAQDPNWSERIDVICP